MPIVRCSAQKRITLEEFYQKLITEEDSTFTQEAGKGMLSLLKMANNTFIKTTLYGLTSLYKLYIQPTDNWKDGSFLSVISLDKNTFELEYDMPSNKSPWRGATVRGLANNIEEAKVFLIIAMVESNGWQNNEELMKLYNKIKA